MSQNLNTMVEIQNEKAKEATEGRQLPLNAETEELAKRKRLTIDVLTVDTDPLR